MWLAPVQVKILPVSDKYLQYSKGVAEKLKEQGIRVETDARDEKLGYKIRSAQLEKIPYMVIIGEKEQEGSSVSVRCRDAERGRQDMGEMALEEFCNMLKENRD